MAGCDFSVMQPNIFEADTVSQEEKEETIVQTATSELWVSHSPLIGSTILDTIFPDSEAAIDLL